jgi:hypothetical protein
VQEQQDKDLAEALLEPNGMLALVVELVEQPLGSCQVQVV